MTATAAELAHVRSAASARSFVPGVVGFFFVARYCLTYLFFQENPAEISFVIIAVGVMLVYAALISEVVDDVWVRCGRISVLRWLMLYLAVTGVSILWSGAESKPTAAAYWIGMVADVFAALLLLIDARTQKENLDQLLKGAVWGGVVLALVGWNAPTLPDLRLGDLVFLHPNTLGLQLGLTTLMAIYLSSYGRAWKWLAIFLAVTLLRTLSKTSILAFAIAGVWMLLQDRALTSARKLKLLLLASFVITCFSGLLFSYLQKYNARGSGNQVETLTGRTVLWITALGLGTQRPWMGHGFYSFRALIPAFGDFEPWHAHNEGIQIFFEFGAIGLAVAITVYWKFFSIMRHASSRLRSLSLSLLIFSLVHGITDTVPFGFSLPLWAIAALPLAGSDQTHAEVAP